jgi:hypothetical protein
VNVAIVKTQKAFVRDETDEAADRLARHVEARGHSAEVIRIPFQPSGPQRVLEHLLAIRLLRLPNVERVVALGFPAYCVAHQHKVVWPLEDRVFDPADTPEGRATANAITSARERHLAEARRILGPEDSADKVIEAVLE